MERIRLGDLNWGVAYDLAVERLNIRENDADEFVPIYEKCIGIMAPLAYYARAEVGENDGRAINIGGVWFESRALCANLKDCKEVYPYVMTCGRAAYDYARWLGDPLYEYWADALCELALMRASEDAAERVRAAEGLITIRYVNPGALPDWHISQQAPLFRLLGDADKQTGVTLTPGFLMLPVKSVSGIWYGQSARPPR